MMAVQISVFLENKSGRLAEVTHALAGAEVNIRALSLAETIDYGVLRLIVDRPKEAKTALADASKLAGTCTNSARRGRIHGHRDRGDRGGDAR